MKIFISIIRHIKKLIHRFKTDRPLIFIDIPEGKLEPQIIKVKSIEGYIPGKTDLVVTVPRRTTINGNKSSPHCLKIEGSIVGDGLTIYNYGVLNPWHDIDFSYRDDGKGVKC